MGDVRRRQMMGGSTPNYIEIQYLGCTGSQFIDTGIAPMSTDKIYYKFGGYSGPNKTMIGCIAKNSDLAMAIVRTSVTSANTWEHDLYIRMFGIKATEFTNPSNVWRVEYTNGQYSLYDNNGPVQRTYDGYQPAVVDSTKYETLTIFKRNGLENSLALNAQCYYLRIVRNEKPILDLIPVRVGQTGYMYDKVTHKLFGNNGSGTFVLGPDL